MAIASITKPKTNHHKKRTAAHHRQSKHYTKTYWPYIPMLLVVVLGFVVSSFMSHPRAVLGWQQNLNQEAMLLATNNQRRANGDPGLSLNTQLIEAAQTKADDMAQKNYWSHTSPTGKQPWEFVVDSGYQYLQAGENLCYGFTSADGVVNGWMDSPEHRATMLNTGYSQVGYGVAQSPDYMGNGAQIIVVAVYAIPQTAANSNDGQARGGWLPYSPNNIQPVSRIQAATPTISGIAVGAVGMLALGIVLLRHGIAWRKLVNRGELFVIDHPVIDTLLVAVVVAAVLLSQTAGFIH